MKVNKTFYIFGLLIIFFLSNNNLFAQKKGKKSSNQGSELRFEFKGIPDTLLYLATYYNGKTHIYDTLYPSKKDRYTFILKKDTLIPRGFYALAGQNMVRYLDFVVDSAFSFTIAFDDNRMSNLRFIGSPENEIMLDFMKNMSHFQRNMMIVDNKIKKEQESDNPDTLLIEKQKEDYRKYRDSMLAFEMDFLDLHRNSLFAKARLMMRDIQVPDSPLNPDGSLIDSNFAFNYYLNHYWDNIDLQESALFNTPSSFNSKLEYYFDHVVPPLIDSTIKYADILLEKTRGNTTVFRFILSYLTSKAERSQYVAHDAIFVHMIQNYYARGCCPWTDEAVLERMINRAEQLEPILIGRKAPELYMYDTNGIFRSNYESKRKYTVMWFWDLNCGVCKTGTAKLLELYERAQDSLDFDVYAIGATNDIDRWKKQLVEKGITSWINVAGNVATIDYRKVYDTNSFPVLLVLDKDKKIIVKRIGVDELENFLLNYDAGKIRY
jgi:hypothetical protein